ncbi:MAG: YlxR family protein [Corynebacterium sp.]|nr:YlxR family protein [Corynebacterium sp.]
MNKPIRQRTCIASRVTTADVNLLRVVEDPAHPGSIIPDPKRRMSGRGAWITPTTQSVERAVKHRAFHRALRLTGPVDVTAVQDYVAALAAAGDALDVTDNEKS